MKKSLRVVYIGLGFVFAGIGMIGIILPVLPTTPFLLLASVCFSRGSTRFSRWFAETKLYKNHLEEFVQNRAMTLRTKIQLVAFASSIMLLSAYLVKSIYVRGFLVLMMMFMYYYFAFRIKTIKSVKPQVLA